MDHLPHWGPGELSARAGVSLRTCRRWRQTRAVPAWAALLIRVLFGGDLGAIDPAWAGWRLSGGKLVSSESLEFSPGDVRALPFMQRQIGAYQTEQRFERQADWVSGKWESRRVDAQDARTAALFNAPPPPPEDYSYLAPGIAKRRARRRLA